MFKELRKYINIFKLVRKVYEHDEIVRKLDFILTSGINKEKINYDISRYKGIGTKISGNQKRLIVSLTSYPERMYDLHYTIYSLLTQKLKPDLLILYLTEEEFPNKEQDISERILQFKENGLTIKWCKNIRSYNKLIPALKEFPEDIIVTADDDIYYPEDWLEKLYNSYLQAPESIHAHRVHKIRFTRTKKLSRYGKWKKCIKDNTSGFLNFGTGVGGVLYPPRALYKDILNEDLFMKLAPAADDIWFWTMAVLNNTKTKVVPEPINDILYTSPERELNLYNQTTLLSENKFRNDLQLKNVLDYYPEIIKKLVKSN